MQNAMTITIHPDKAVGPVKPVNGVGQPPMVGALKDWPMMHYLKEAGIPFSRLHDVGGYFGGGLYVDIPNLFPDFDADETDPANYRFVFTDSLIDALVENGVEPFFRLGVSIENWPAYAKPFPRLRTDPPKDFAKWARICEHVIRHYTEGWAGGFHHTITHWEIWNEPENWPDPEKNEMWHGSFAEYCRLYEVASKHLKAAFPHLKIGGYASCGVAWINSWKENRAKHHVECFHKFLAFVRERDCPLDFYSFHSYSRVPNMMEQARYVRDALDNAGFRDVPTCLDEWLPHASHEKLGTALQATEIAAALIAFQNGPVDSAAIYDARCAVGNYSPLFNPLTYTPHKAYYAFTAFHELRKRGTAVEVKILNTETRRHGDAETSSLPSSAPLRLCVENIFAAAARGEDGSLAVMVANPGDDAVPFSLEISGGIRRRTVESCRITDKDHTDAENAMPRELPPHSFLVAVFNS